MRNALVMAGALLVLTSAPAYPAGLELAWNACFGQPGAAEVKSPTCDANTGSQSLFVSFRPPAGVTRLEGLEVFVDYQMTSGSTCSCPLSPHDTPYAGLPCWWNFASGQARDSQFVPLHVSPTGANGAPLIPCDNHSFLDNGASGGGGMIVTGVNRGQLRGIAAIAAGTGLPVAAGAQQYAAGFRIMNGSTTPPGTCDGCAAAACFAVNTIRLTSAGLPDVVLQSPQLSSEHVALWQSNHIEICYTPIRQNTWGGIKSLYR